VQLRTSDSGYVVAELPAELFFTDGNDCAEIPSVTPQWIAFHQTWSDVPLARLIPHRQLVEHFLTASPTQPRQYLQWHRNVFETRGLPVPLRPDQVLVTEYEKFSTWRDGLLNRPQLFWEEPVEVRLNPKGYFNIRNGHHRAMFLYCHGWRRIPARLKAEELEEWINAPAQEAAWNEVRQQGRMLFYTPILNPSFYGIHAERDSVHQTRLDLILRYLGSRRVTGKTLLDIGSNIGFYARHFRREGAKVTGVEPDEYHVRLAERVNQLTQVEYDSCSERLETASIGVHDLGLMLSVFYHFFQDSQNARAFIRKVDQCVDELLFWESGDQPTQERKYILNHTHFRSYTPLGKTYGTGKAREMGVFMNGLHEMRSPG